MTAVKQLIVDSVPDFISALAKDPESEPPVQLPELSEKNNRSVVTIGTLILSGGITGLILLHISDPLIQQFLSEILGVDSPDTAKTKEIETAFGTIIETFGREVCRRFDSNNIECTAKTQLGSASLDMEPTHTEQLFFKLKQDTITLDVKLELPSGLKWHDARVEEPVSDMDDFEALGDDGEDLYTLPEKIASPSRESSSGSVDAGPEEKETTASPVMPDESVSFVLGEKKEGIPEVSEKRIKKKKQRTIIFGFFLLLFLAALYYTMGDHYPVGNKPAGTVSPPPVARAEPDIRIQNNIPEKPADPEEQFQLALQTLRALQDNIQTKIRRLKMINTGHQADIRKLSDRLKQAVSSQNIRSFQQGQRSPFIQYLIKSIYRKYMLNEELKAPVNDAISLSETLLFVERSVEIDKLVNPFFPEDRMPILTEKIMHAVDQAENISRERGPISEKNQGITIETIWERVTNES